MRAAPEGSTLTRPCASGLEWSKSNKMVEAGAAFHPESGSEHTGAQREFLDDVILFLIEGTGRKNALKFS